MSTRNVSIILLAAIVSTASLPSSAIAQPPAGARRVWGDDIDKKVVSFEMRDKPWAQILEWLSDATGLPVCRSIWPSGTFTYIAPKKGNLNKSSIADVLDIFNLALRSQQFAIVRQNRQFIIVPGESGPVGARLANVEELEKHPKTELVALVVPLKILQADICGPLLIKLMSTSGEVYVLPAQNSLYLQDDAATLKQVVVTIKTAENVSRFLVKTWAWTAF
jgi:type II secretory pathway component GspD/PulD (secretin)